MPTILWYGRLQNYSHNKVTKTQSRKIKPQYNYQWRDLLKLRKKKLKYWGNVGTVASSKKTEVDLDYK